ncbi:T7SS effector LXG polymorphic toxin [Bacillus sp. WMMC1349]|uniref:T7SS effector LXG polymorphic toxin n=1 Tax=Bacillus sp. WMMC1349 TaxID=2736254 RepID=UPI0028156CBC|nr:T7SS effector LXG polymorphic toxin [Bacillus sp. WMMC1349]
MAGKTACLGVADLGDDFTGKGADNIKEFFRGQAEVVDSWITLADMQISFFNGVSGDIEAKKLPDSYIEMSFLKTELKNADKKSDQIVSDLKKNMDAIINRVSDIVDLDKWTDHNYTVEMSKAQTTRKNAIDAVDDLDKSLTGEYTQALAEAESVSKKYEALMEATSNGKSASPMYFDKKAFHSNKLYKEAIKTDKQATTYINAKKEQAEARRIAELQEKLANVSDPDEYVKMAKEIGYNNLSPEQQERLTEIKEDKEFWDNPFLGTLNKAGDMVVGSASEAFEAGKSIASDVGESLENGLHTIAHPIETMENVRDGLHAIGEEIDNAASAVWDKVSHPKEILNATWDNITHPMETLEGIGEGIKNVASDTVDGVLYTVNHPFETIAGVSHVVSHPVDTLNIMKKGIADSFERDVINGDAKSRAKWFMYATGTVATSVVGTKGVDKLGKAAKLGKLGNTGTKIYKFSKKVKDKTIRLPKKAVKKGVEHFNKTKQRVKNGIRMYNPFESQVEFAGVGEVPFNVLDGENKRDSLIQRIEELPKLDKGKVIVNPNGKFENAPYHGKTSNSVKSKAPIDGQAALNNSVSIGPNTNRRVGISHGEIVILDQTNPGVFHGHVRSWNELNPQMQSALRKAKLVNKKGKIIGD